MSLHGHGCASSQVRKSASEPWTSCRRITCSARMSSMRAACLRRRRRRREHVKARAFQLTKVEGNDVPAPRQGAH
eukprot:7531652-Pyramimonas_sp.AAC.1